MSTPKANKYRYTVINISQDDEVGYKAIIPQFPKLYVVADTPTELHEAVQVAIEEEVKFYKKSKLKVPTPDVKKFSGKFILRIRPEIHEALAQLSSAEGKTLNQYLNNIIEKKIN